MGLRYETQLICLHPFHLLFFFSCSHSLDFFLKQTRLHKCRVVKETRITYNHSIPFKISAITQPAFKHPTDSQQVKYWFPILHISIGSLCPGTSHDQPRRPTPSAIHSISSDSHGSTLPERFHSVKKIKPSAIQLKTKSITNFLTISTNSFVAPYTP